MVSLFIRDADEVSALRAMLGYDSNPDVSNAMIIDERDAAAERLAVLRTVGVDHIIVNLPLIQSAEQIEQAGAVLAEVCA